MLQTRALILALLLAGPAQAQPPTMEQMCAMVWDVTLVTRTLAKHGVTREKSTAMLADIYNQPDEPARQLVSRLADFSYQHDTEPRALAAAVRAACLHGVLDKLLGIES